MSAVVPQPVVARLTRAAIFLVVRINPGKDGENGVRRLCALLSALLRAVGFRDPEARLSCVMAIGSDAWDRLFGDPRPKDLHPFREIHGVHHAVSTPGDILFHIRSVRMDLCFELASQIMSRLGKAVTTIDEVHGFKYFDDRDLLGFVDGTENPSDQDAVDATTIDRRTLHSSAEATSSPRSICTICSAGMRYQPRSRKISSVVTNCRTSSRTMRPRRPTHIMF
ncbi:Dyp-type peroxidase family [Bradyrhizobium elkanii]|uniref:Dyp-type peroxidase family n=1 Tax=Bradyrhizobium elkanii TaxID=29448 RepID=A0A8I2BXQ7_BRAEL|nr:Dyp-type peroxidase family [Bradyrhizobium elkanii]